MNSTTLSGRLQIKFLMTATPLMLLLLLLCWCQTLGLSSASTGMFNNGAGDLVLHFIAQCNSQLTEILAEQQNKVQLSQAECVYTHLLSFTARMYFNFISTALPET